MPDDYEVDDYSSELSLKFRDVSLTSAAPDCQDMDDAGRRRELEALSAAMMTVDNGFENQWWYQGERQQTSPLAETLPASMPCAATAATVEAVPQSPEHQPSYDSRESMGWATFQDDPHVSMVSAMGCDASGLVSPLTEFASPRIHRSMTTRSEELCLYS
ncbi:hypothetical protein LX36DRAFT_582220 [Colletotrichum falcatum]|nr:hypothetical protein LX36DRAFT_582220 [Colletotrichum falcatum]